MKASLLSFVRGAKYSLNGQMVEVESVDVKEGTAILKAHYPNKASLRYSLAELSTMFFRGELNLPSDTPASHEPTWKATLKPLTQEQRKRVERRIAYTNACTPLYPVGPLSRRLSTAIAEVAQRLGDKRPPSPHSVYRWVRRYILSNYNTAVFFQDAGAIRQRKPRVDKGVRDLLAVEIERLLGVDKKATLHGVMDEALASVAKQLGHIHFIAKDGSQQVAAEFIVERERQRAQVAEEEQKKRRQTKQDERKTEDYRAAA
jgi:hypothetical protein